ncbi:MAG: transporter [Bacteroidia bacterium]|nr:transporter [Bacteroidia bacterium]
MKKYRSLVLPAVIILGLIFHRFCGALAFISPYLIFAILLLTFCAVDIRKLKPTLFDLWLVIIQLWLCLGGYFLIMLLSRNRIVAEGVMVGILCPVASSVAVISTALGADRQTVTRYTIIGNLAVAFIAPVIFSFMGGHQSLPFIASFRAILKKIGSAIALPFVVALFLQMFLPKVNDGIARFKELAFYIWASALLITLGQTIDFIFLHGSGQGASIAALAVSSVIVCLLQFFVGRWLGRRYGDKVAGGQLLFQKNSAMGIWMANTYLNPLASVFSACYSIIQNLINSIQMWLHDRNEQ